MWKLTRDEVCLIFILNFQQAFDQYVLTEYSPVLMVSLNPKRKETSFRAADISGPSSNFIRSNKECGFLFTSTCHLLHNL